MATVELTAEAPRWNPATRIAFRFLFIYLLLSILSPFSQLGGGALWYFSGLLETASLLWNGVVAWVGKTVFGVTISFVFSGSGDSTFSYVEAFCWAAMAAATTLVWSFVDRKRASYPRLFEVLRVVVRLVLALQMISYGTAKVLPLQFGTLTPSRLVAPVGEIPPMGLLWTFMAASTAYTFFGGAAELLGGLLLVFRRTTLLGAMVTAGVMTQVVMLNYCYDVCVKLLSSQLLAMAIFLTLPDLKRLWSFFVLGRAIVPVPMRPRFQRRWLNWSISGVTVGLFAFLMLQSLIGAYSYCQEAGLFGPAPRLHGVWDVVEFERDGQVVPPLATDSLRWNEVLIKNAGPGAAVIAFKPMRGPSSWQTLEIAEAARRMTIGDVQNPANPPVTLIYEEPAPDALVLSGSIDGKQIHVTLHRAPAERFRLVNRGFHWINEVPSGR
jgi:hypothetical protein